ncbi:MAG: class I SAM-dependent methyltransferase [Pseudomonadota bacterium]
MTAHDSFTFGKNWKHFLGLLDDESTARAVESLTEFMGIDNLHGRSFVDIGCGSGLFSYAAWKLGASKVVSFDIDPDSEACAKFLRKQSGNPPNWEVFGGSILDPGLVERLGSFDIVYSWGVLHHTGRMWDALRASATLVKPGGYLYIALYNKLLSRSGGASWIHRFWTKIKLAYNAHPRLGTFVLEPLAMSAYMAMVIARGENPVSHLRSYKSHRGMSWRTDAVDWLGGYPYEYATVEEVFKFVTDLPQSFELRNIKVTSGRGLNWYLFQREG